MRTSEDVLRSFKRYLALALADGRTRLAAARTFLDPSDFDPLATYPSAGPADFLGARNVWFDVNPAGNADAYPLEVADTAGLVRLGFWDGFNFWGNPPGRRFDGSIPGLVVQQPDDTSVSPGLVASCSEVSQADFAEALSGGRWADTPELETTDTSMPYRLAMLTGTPAVTLGSPISASAIPEPLEWDVRYSHDFGEIRYPAAIVKPVGPGVVAGHRYYSEVTQAFVIYAYPRKPNEADVDGSSVQVRAERVRQLLADALTRTVGRNAAAPMRIPLYDYDGVPADQPSGRREEHDYLRVVDASVDVMPEPSDTRMAVVIADVRLNWRQSIVEQRGSGVVAALNLEIIET